MTIGHQAITAFFDRAIADGTLAQAYCFIGAGSLGKRTLAREVSTKLLGTSAGALASHADYTELVRVEDEKTGKLKRDISVAQARALKEKLQATAWLKGYKVVVVDEAELMSLEAANALLKLLEEPPAKTIFFLLTEDEGRLLPTIKSRTQLFYFSFVSESEIREALKKEGVTSADTLARFATGRPGIAFTLARDEEVKGEWDTYGETFSQLIGQPFYNQVKILEKTIGDDDDTQRTRDRLRAMLRLWTLTARSGLLATLAVDRAAYTVPHPTWQFSPERTVTLLDSFARAEKLLHDNINPRLLLETIALSL